MPSINNAVSMTGMGVSISSDTARTADGGAIKEIAVSKGQSGVLSMRTDDDTGTIEMDSSNHGFVALDNIDVYWSGGLRRSMQVTSVADSTVSINSGSGDVLPPATTSVVGSEPVDFNCAIDGDELSIIAAEQAYESTTETADSYLILSDVSVSIASFTLKPNTPRTFDITGGDTNPFTGNPIIAGKISNGSAINDATLKLMWIQDSTP